MSKDSIQEAIDDILDYMSVELKRKIFLAMLKGEPMGDSISRQVERKKGKWVGYDDDKAICKCSECGATIGINEKYRNFFCYHCGADMREEDE